MSRGASWNEGLNQCGRKPACFKMPAVKKVTPHIVTIYIVKNINLDWWFQNSLALFYCIFPPLYFILANQAKKHRLKGRNGFWPFNQLAMNRICLDMDYFTVDRCYFVVLGCYSTVHRYYFTVYSCSFSVFRCMP